MKTSATALPARAKGDVVLTAVPGDPRAYRNAVIAAAISPEPDALQPFIERAEQARARRDRFRLISGAPAPDDGEARTRVPRSPPGST